MKTYCPTCDGLSEIEVRSMDESFQVRGEKVDIKSEVATCNECGSKVFNQELDGRNLTLVYSTYRKKHNLLSPTDIVCIRKKYSLSQRALALLLEWGEVTVNRYENGAIQDPAHDEVLMFISEPRNMKRLFEKNNHLLSKTTRERARRKLDELINNELNPDVRLSLLQSCLSSSQTVDEYSGFTTFALEKMINMIVYIAEKSGGVFTTKLNKLLWYADFLYFKEYSISISGSSYCHLPLGPVPTDYKWIIAAAIGESLLSEEEIIFSREATGTQFRALTSADKSHFSKEEIKIMDFVIHYFRGYNAREIKEKSHKEKAYQETRSNERISYKYAAALSISLGENPQICPST